MSITFVLCLKNQILLVRNLLLLILWIPFISCENGNRNDSSETWVGGQIINPKSDYVILYKDNNLLDSVKLNSENFFLYKMDSVTPGLYSFTHKEYQIFYLEPGDSIMLRVNTLDFDESLTYSGKGAAQNNLLIDFFLLNENENTLMPPFYRLSPSAFENKIDSLKKIRLQFYSEFDQKHNPGKGFKKIAIANINYDYYSKKELYTSANAANKNLKADDFPKNFYDYRDKIEFGNTSLRAYYPYYRFLNRYFDNLAHSQNNPGTGYLNRNSYVHNISKIKIIDSLVKCDTLKNNLLRSCTKRYLINGKDADNEKRIVALFKQANTNKAHHLEISKLVEATTKLTPGNTLPNVMLVNYDNVMKDMHSVVNRPTVLFFWSAEFIKHFKNLHSRAFELKDKYPEYDFKGINTDTHFKKWRGVVQKSGYNKLQEFQLENVKDAEMKLLLNSMNKAIFLDENSIIIDANTNLFSPKFEEMLLGYLNK